MGTELWRDKRSEEGDALLVTRVEAKGYAVSNVRKGTTKNVFEFEPETGLRVFFHGTRGGAQLEVCVAAADELSHEFLEEAQEKAAAAGAGAGAGARAGAGVGAAAAVAAAVTVGGSSSDGGSGGEGEGDESSKNGATGGSSSPRSWSSAFQCFSGA